MPLCSTLAAIAEGLEGELAIGRARAHTCYRDDWTPPDNISAMSKAIDATANPFFLDSFKHAMLTSIFFDPLSTFVTTRH